MDGKKNKNIKNLAITFVVLFGIVSLFSDMTYEGGRSLVGQFLKILGAGAVAVGIAAGAGELLGYSLRLISGIIADKTKKYWFITIFGYCFQLLALPMLAFVGRWEIAILLVFAERIGKAIRNPARDALLSYATSQTGSGFGFGLHEALDQIGAITGPLILATVLFFKGHKNISAISDISVYKFSFLILFIPAILAIVTIFITKILVPTPSKLQVKSPRIGAKGFSKAFWIYLIGAGLIACGFIDFPLIAYHFKKINILPEYWIPILYSVSMGVDALFALIFGYIYDKKGFIIVIIAFAISSVFAPFVYLGTVIPAVFGLILWGIGMGAVESIMRAVVSDLVPQDKKATAFGMFHMGFGIMWFLGSSIIGLLYDNNQILILVIFSVAIQLSAIPVFIIANNLKNKKVAY
jgi:MFS family permease